MKSKKNILLPRAQKALFALGNNLKLARLRRKLSMAMVAERANISRATLGAIESGAPSVAIGAYTQVLFVLGLEEDLQKVALDDTLGRKLQDAGLPIRARAPKSQE
ncbi:MAG: helix-turn-helix transcriptional regulator [Fibrobacteria bacterium]|nr:helix-turn-helix transcriptional regulator [Fibrobacteria bacterium]